MTVSTQRDHAMYSSHQVCTQTNASEIHDHEQSIVFCSNDDFKASDAMFYI